MNTDEGGCEDEMEWLMEETGTPTREPQENGHITTKPVSADALRSFSLDEQDSEDEVLTVPGVRIAPSSSTSSRLQSAFLKAESDEDLVGLLVDTRSRNKTRYSNRNQRKPQPDPDDSDEDLLKVWERQATQTELLNVFATTLQLFSCSILCFLKGNLSVSCLRDSFQEQVGRFVH